MSLTKIDKAGVEQFLCRSGISMLTHRKYCVAGFTNELLIGSLTLCSYFSKKKELHFYQESFEQIFSALWWLLLLLLLLLKSCNNFIRKIRWTFDKWLQSVLLFFCCRGWVLHEHILRNYTRTAYIHTTYNAHQIAQFVHGTVNQSTANNFLLLFKFQNTTHTHTPHIPELWMQPNECVVLCTTQFSFHVL